MKIARCLPDHTLAMETRNLLTEKFYTSIRLWRVLMHIDSMVLQMTTLPLLHRGRPTAA
jgi:hypothetical protein